MEIRLPNNFTPRPYQLELMRYLDNGGTRAACVWHRRAGKDTTAAHQIAKAAHRRRGLYWHILPSQRQGRKVVWDALTRSGERLIDQVFPPPLRQGDPNSTEMKLNLKCGSIYQVVGGDMYDALVGANPIGVVFSEWSLTDPRLWDYIRPILMENGGWAVFIYTPRGYNHGHDTMEIAKSTGNWFFSRKTVDDTGIITPKQIDDERKEGMPEELVQQEFYCSFSAANVGAVLGALIEKATNEGRISDDLEYDASGSELLISGDIGFRDTAAWWFWQVKPDGFGLIDYTEDNGMDAQDWIDRFKTLSYPVKKLYLPHDARAKTFQTRNSVLEQFLQSGFPVEIVPRVGILDRINAARVVLPHCHFHETRCSRGLMALREWSYEWDDVRRAFSKTPVHNWASHGGDAFTYGAAMVAGYAAGWNAARREKEARQQTPAKTLAGAHYAFHLDQLHGDRAQAAGRFMRL